MLVRTLLYALAAAALSAASASAQIIDYAKYPDLAGQWRPIGGPGRSRYQQAVWALTMAQPLDRGISGDLQATISARPGMVARAPLTYKCLSPGMPRVTNAWRGNRTIITPDTTYILMDHVLRRSPHLRPTRAIGPRILEFNPVAYSIGKWDRQQGQRKTTTFSRWRPMAFAVRAARRQLGLPLHWIDVI